LWVYYVNVVDVQLYDVLKEQRGPSFCDNVKAVQGDMLEDRLGLSDEDRQLLEDNVNIVFHSAATVRFDEQLRCVYHLHD
jgi:fatty acyl-CoA reductase